MISLKNYNRQAGRMVVAVAMLAATIVSSFLPALAWAAQTTERSIEMSSSSKGATGVSYRINFTPATTAAGFIVEFCTDSPLIGAACDDPSSTMNLASVGFSSPVTAATGVESGGSKRVAVTVPLTGGTPVSAVLTGITNPTAGGTNGALYARITTYANMGATSYTDAEHIGTVVDQGSVALSLTDTIGVTAAVLETMTFCVSAPNVGGTNPIGDNCAGAIAPTIEIGETSGSVKALSTSAVSTGDIFTQLSTNASGGAVVALKSTAAGCGGMKLVGGPNGNCYIAPATGAFTGGTPRFGVLVDTDAGTDGSSPNGTVQAINGYNDTTYLMNYNGTDESTGVTSTYGDPIFDTDGAPVNHKAMKLTFGASINNQTPAGKYAADLSLIATGTF